MPQLDLSTFPTQLFWLIVSFGLLYLILWRFVLPQVGEVRTSRQIKIGSDLDRAEELKREAESIQAAYEKALAEATAEAQSVHRETAQAIAAERQAKQATLTGELSNEAAKAERRIEGEKQAAMQQLGDVAAGLVQASVERLVGAHVETAEADAAVKAVAPAA